MSTLWGSNVESRTSGEDNFFAHLGSPGAVPFLCVTAHTKIWGGPSPGQPLSPAHVLVPGAIGAT